MQKFPWQRTHYAGELRSEHTGHEVVLLGWVQKRRDLGGLIFIDLRDRTGMVQLTLDPDTAPLAFQAAEGVRSEYVLAAKGKVARRPEGGANLDLPTGEVEVHISELAVLNTAKTPPFYIVSESDADESLRLRYRYLDLRRPDLQSALITRHLISQAARSFLNGAGFLEIETPMLTRSTPEGARDYLVPSRVNPGSFYALPQSPQLFKQLLMAAGFDRYYQLARCFRDEDLRADRQPEFTQIDVELSFASEEDIICITEGLVREVMTKVAGLDEATLEFPRMTYREAMERYGVDKPDTRFGMELADVTAQAKQSDFKVFQTAPQVKAINAKGAAAGFSRKDIDRLAEYVAPFGARGLAWMVVEGEGAVRSPISKFFAEEALVALLTELAAEPGDLLLFVADEPPVCAAALGALRLHLGKLLDLIPQNTYNFLWVTEFPLLEWNAEGERFIAAHHPFTQPIAEDLPLLSEDPGAVRARAYDLVLNGYELAGGSIRIHERAMQERIFAAIGIDEAEARRQFGFLLEAFDYGFPPHGGIAFGLDRFAMILARRPSIRDVIAFPKTTSASDLLTAAPSPAEQAQLDELSLTVRPKA